MRRWPARCSRVAGCCGAPAPRRAADARRSGFDFMSPATQAMQRDDTQNPGMLWVQRRRGAVERKAGAQRHSPAPSCHGDARAVDARRGGALPGLRRGTAAAGRPRASASTLCRQTHQQAPPLRAGEPRAAGAGGLCGAPVARPADRAAATTRGWRRSRERGRALFEQRIGQLDLSCAQCHDDNWPAGAWAAASIPQAHPTGYPIYRLEWQGLGSLQRRLRGCMSGVRAEPFALGATELVELELYLAQRAAGMRIETPAVRP